MQNLPLNSPSHNFPSQSTLVDWLSHTPYPPYRASQISNYLNSGVTDPAQMSTLPKTLRALLQSSDAPLLSLLPPGGEIISLDGTIKRAYVLRDGSVVESVLMSNSARTGHTACISSQVGCAQACAFCATGQMGFSRQLTADEIVAQVREFDAMLRRLGSRLDRVVFMGMGEPLANYKNVVKAVKEIQEAGIGWRKITISTVGVAHNIRRLASDLPQVGLAVSLHESDEEKRSALLPANARYGGIAELLSAVKYHCDETGRRATFEWALIDGNNDTPETARRLGVLLAEAGIKPSQCHVNVIPLNPTDGFSGSKSGMGRVRRFCEVLEAEFGVSATVRGRRGVDVDAGCGQLKSVIEKRRRRGEVKEEAETEKGGEMVFNTDGDGDGDGGGGEGEGGSLPSGPIDLDEVDAEDVETNFDAGEAARLLSVVTPPSPSPSQPSPLKEKVKKTKITDSQATEEVEKQLKKLRKKLKGIARIERAMADGGTINDDQRKKLEGKKGLEEEMEELRVNLKVG